jgi:hypothetical protein
VRGAPGRARTGAKSAAAPPAGRRLRRPHGVVRLPSRHHGGRTWGQRGPQHGLGIGARHVRGGRPVSGHDRLQAWGAQGPRHGHLGADAPGNMTLYDIYTSFRIFMYFTELDKTN